jgi:hypothetical protein
MRVACQGRLFFSFLAFFCVTRNVTNAVTQEISDPGPNKKREQKKVTHSFSHLATRCTITLQVTDTHTDD